ncbi:MAG: LysM peptidoglycan-binding domain-containing protein [Flavobacteriia bacterium]|nr:LysM peptidoglycan-binding domain-containing protein [Flavobacteriia bacterium]
MMQCNKILQGVVVSLICSVSWAQKPTNSDTLNPIPFVNTVAQSLQMFYADYANSKYSDSIIKALNYEPQAIPLFTDEVYCQRLAIMNDESPFGFDCNSISLSSIRFFAENRRSFVKIVLGRSALYFDLFEEKLSEYGLPLELKYLACIESGLRPQVKSRAGALGLWQFMYRTGLHYGLEESSYFDERMDPVKATDAACRFLKKLYGIYGDWNLALAAYNAGPGNVNKAIQRSGNKRTYWEIRPYLPSETQGYVPTFIAAAYMMRFHQEHNIMPAPAKWQEAQLDTMCLKKGLNMKIISEHTGWDLQEIKDLNPIYKTEYIPASAKQRCIMGPLDRILLLVAMEDSLYSLSNSNQNTSIITTMIENKTPLFEDDSISGNDVFHKVKQHETIDTIAKKYKVSPEQILEWNALQTTNLYEGQRLLLKNTNTQPIQVENPPAPKPAQKAKKYHTVKSGDTMGKIAAKYHLSLSQLKKLNPGKGNVIQVGDKIRVK